MTRGISIALNQEQLADEGLLQVWRGGMNNDVINLAVVMQGHQEHTGLNSHLRNSLW